MTTPHHTRPSPWARLRARPRLLLPAGVVGAAGVAFVLWWFQPQALLFDRVVDEEFPAAAPAPDAVPAGGQHDGAPDPERPMGPGSDAEDAAAEAGTEEAAVGPAGPRILSDGTFASRNRYTVTGGAAVYELEDGSRTLRLEPFASTNGPDLYVYLTAADDADDDAALEADHVDLGDLRGNIGNQSYAIPGDVDLTAYDTVVIWCRRFSVSFGAADLTPVDG